MGISEGLWGTQGEEAEIGNKTTHLMILQSDCETFTICSFKLLIWNGRRFEILAFFF